MNLIDADSGDVLLSQLEIADTFWKRFKGLQFRRSMASESGMILSPCSSLHTCFMRFPIDLIMLGHDDSVIGVRRSVRPWRAVFCEPGTKKVIETSVGELDVELGRRIVVSG